MSEDFMRCPGVRPHGAGFRLRCRVPADVAHHFPSPYRIQKLDAATPRAAHAAGLVVLSGWEAEYERLRTTGSSAKTTISDEDLQRLTAAMVHESLTHDEKAREDGVYADDALYEKSKNRIALFKAALHEEIGRGKIGFSEGDALNWLWAHGYDIPRSSPEYPRIVLAFAKAHAGALQIEERRLSGELVDTPPAPPPFGSASAETPLMLGEVVRQYLARTTHSAQMLKKHTVTLGLLLEAVGDRPVTELRQKDIHDFLGVLCQLPPRWKDEQRRRGLSVRELAAMPWPSCIAPKTYEDGYVASLRPFLLDSINLYGDQGFPLNLNTTRAPYSGTRAADERQQRAMSQDELVRLFTGPEYREFAADPAHAHRYWLPLVGLFTGARINELCQINPQCDIREEDGIPFIDITDKSPGDPRILKSVKNKSSRRVVPIHPELLRLGFLRYVREVREAGHMRLFPSFPLKGKSAGAGPGTWFRKLLGGTGLRDETEGAAVVGFHAFRSTFLSRAMHLDVPGAQWLTGHIDPSVSMVVREYRGKLELNKKLQIIERITYDIEFPSPRFAAP
ncbi:MAG: site-specific integrase [Methyloversatilis sp.]|nr:site-specific integrase [Methyloversatilis sp.]